jgi:hypothetical protein
MGGSNSQYENDFGISSAFGAGNAKIVFLRARRWRALKKTIFISNSKFKMVTSNT